MDIRLTPKLLNGQVDILPSKSHGHRLMIASALAGGKSWKMPLASQESSDLVATRRCLASLLAEEDLALHCGESGSTLRFLLPVAAVLKGHCAFYGEGRLLNRPLSPLAEEMERMGCRFFFDKKEEGLICGLSGKLTSGTYRLAGNVSSQFITGLLFALPLLPGDSEIFLTSPLESSGYVDMTLSVLWEFGITVKMQMEGGLPSYHIRGSQSYKEPPSLMAEGDWSNGAFWLTADYLGRRRREGAAVICQGLDSASTQGDRAIVPLLSYMGENKERTIDASQIPDLVPILAVAAALTPGITRIEKAERLRIKESDRLAAMTEELSALGADIEELPDGLLIRGGEFLSGGIANGHNDHRIVMAMAIASCGCVNPVTIKGAEAVNKSYPGFFEDFTRLGGDTCEL